MKYDKLHKDHWKKHKKLKEKHMNKKYPTKDTRTILGL